MGEVFRLFNKKLFEGTRELLKKNEKKITKRSIEIEELYFAEWYRNFPNEKAPPIEQFNAASVSLTRSGIGEETQIEVLQKYFPNVIKLPKGNGRTNDRSMRLLKENNKLIVRESPTSNITFNKSFDMYLSYHNKEYFINLRTQDINFLSETTGGGHQTNAQKELFYLCEETIKTQPLYKDNPINIAILINGRTEDKIIKKCREIAGNCNYLIIDTVERFVESLK